MKPLMEELNSISLINENKVENNENKVEVNEVQVVVNENKVEVSEVQVVVNENKVEVSEIVEVNEVSKSKVMENKKNKLKLDNIEITSDDELVNINVVNENNNNVEL
jgi:hypothetical protein